jgi:hypothetical protein
MALHKAPPASGKPLFILQNVAKHDEKSMKKNVTGLSFWAPVALSGLDPEPQTETSPARLLTGLVSLSLSDIRPDARYGLSPIVPFKL